MTAPLDQFVLDYAPGPVATLEPAILRARDGLSSLLATMFRATDDELRVQWDWDGVEADVRYAFYRALETLESARSRAELAVRGSHSTEAREAVATATAARWDLQGLLATLDDPVLDADPGNGEWTVRETLAHIIGSQRGYAWGTAWWLSDRDQPRREGEQRAPEEVFAAMPDESAEAVGTLEVVRRNLDDVVDGTSSRYATLTDDDLGVKAGWSGVPVTVGFRQWRWSSHIQEHTVQVEKTLDMLGRTPSEVQRLIRLVARAFGRLEAVAFYLPSAGAAAGVLEDVGESLHGISSTLGAALDAGLPATREF